MLQFQQILSVSHFWTCLWIAPVCFKFLRSLCLGNKSLNKWKHSLNVMFSKNSLWSLLSIGSTVFGANSIHFVVHHFLSSSVVAAHARSKPVLPVGVSVVCGCLCSSGVFSGEGGALLFEEGGGTHTRVAGGVDVTDFACNVAQATTSRSNLFIISRHSTGNIILLAAYACCILFNLFATWAFCSIIIGRCVNPGLSGMLSATSARSTLLRYYFNRKVIM